MLDTLSYLNKSVKQNYIITLQIYLIGVTARIAIPPYSPYSPYSPYFLIFIPILLIDLHDCALMCYDIVEGFCSYLYIRTCEVV
jgi:hypothetical protein